MFDVNKFKANRELIHYQSAQSNIAMSNKYFSILHKLVSDKKLKKSHVAYTYSYLYLQTYLFRYTKYDSVVLSLEQIKSLLGFNPKYRDINYITKQNGLLDSEGLTITLYDFPVIHEWIDGQIEFQMLSHFNEDSNAYGTKWRQMHDVNFNMSCKYPALSFYDNLEDVKKYGFQLSNMNGTYFNPSYTTIIDFDIFNYCMSHSSLGCAGFYIYCYIAFQNGLKGNCQMSVKELAKNCSVGVQTMQTYLNTLRQYNLIHTEMADSFIIGNKKRKADANTHFHNEFSDFIKDNNTVNLTKPNYIFVQNLDTIDF